MSERSLRWALDLAAVYRDAKIVKTDEELVDVILSMYPEIGIERLTEAMVQEKVIRGPRGPSLPEIVQAPVQEKALADAIFGLFTPIVGYDDVKDLFFRALVAETPVHILLQGPPASAKTLFLMELAALPGSYFAVGGGTTKAGLTQALFTYTPTYLLLDEIETVDNPKDYSTLLHLMENQEVVETKYGRHFHMPLVTWVFAAGNDVSGLPPALLSRFGGKAGILQFKEYAANEFLEIATSVLVKREGLAEGFAQKVAEATIATLGSRDVRMAVRLGRLARDEEGLAKVVETMRRRR